MSSSHSTSNSNRNWSDSKLAILLEQCADVTRRGQFHPMLYDAQKALHEYIGRVTASNPNNNNSNNNSNSNSTNAPNNSKNDHAQYDALRAARTAFESNPTNDSNKSELTNVFENPTSNPNKYSFAKNYNSSSNSSSGLDLKGLFKNISLPGTSSSNNNHNSSNSISSSSHIEHEWCDEHFTMGCMCKVRKQQQQKQQPSFAQTNTKNNNMTSNNTTKLVRIKGNSNTSSTVTKPNFQRPANPKSSTLASGHVDMLRSNFLTRAVWKEVLVSLIDGVKSSSDGFTFEKEPTLLVQKNEGTAHGIPDLKDVAQVPVPMIEDVSSLATHGEFKFSLRIRGQTEEMIFRCRDEESMTNWTVTILSAKDASSESRRRRVQQNHQNSNLSGKQNGNVYNSKSVSAPSAPSHPAAPTNSAQGQQRMTIKELRAIAHGEGINTVGMERKDLEKIAAEVAAMRPPPPPPANAPVPGPSQAQRAEQERIQREREIALQQQKLQEQRLREQQEQEHRRQQQKIAEDNAAAEQRRKLINEKRAEEDRIRQQQKLAEQRAAEERRKEALLNAQRAVEQKAAEDRRRVELAEAERRRHEAEQMAAQARQQYQANSSTQPQRQNQNNDPFNFSSRNDQQHYFSQTQQQQHNNFGQAGANSNQGPSPPQRPPQSNNQTGAESPRNQKYSNAMKNLSSNNGTSSHQEAITAIKRNILGQWALNPPAMTMLRSVDQLICTIHNVFPPAHGVASHVYFSKWKPVAHSDLRSSSGPMSGGNIDEDKLKKSIKKLRFFLHPDKLPRDLNPEQEFICKMLWDITNDADAEYQARKEQLDWIN